MSIFFVCEEACDVNRANLRRALTRRALRGAFSAGEQQLSRLLSDIPHGKVRGEWERAVWLWPVIQAGQLWYSAHNPLGHIILMAHLPSLA